MITKDEGDSFAQRWIEAWNSRNLETILRHYTDNFEITSPFIAELLKEPGGTLRGRDTIRKYWEKGLERVSDLHFELIETVPGVDSIVIFYHGVFGRKAAEMMVLDDELKVVRAVAHYR